MCLRCPAYLWSLVTIQQPLARSPTASQSLRCYGKDGGGSCGCGCRDDGGNCNCGVECPCQELGRLGPSPRNKRDLPMGCTPQVLLTKAFTLPAYMPASLFRIVAEDELPGPRTCSNQEYFSYHRYSYYDLKTVVGMLKRKASTDCK
ncbi:uncharacterized protein LOC111075653 [Drosophila obscura]|uniref:uncharacterized protein LOC111075653 n=1 Tax=Drosophila obscura TaxID=7282 RepID=UPI001BB17807|nr:uncharacterized protein LOC111075653 [Drosophila obscura]